MTIAEMKKKNREDALAARAIINKAKQENRAMTDEEAGQVKTLLDGVEARTKAIETEERLAGIETAQAAAPALAHRAAPAEDEDATRVEQPEVRCIVMQRDGSFKPGRVINPKQEFRTFGEQLQAIARAADGHRDQRLVEQRAATGAGETIPSDGGFLVQQDFAAELFMRTYSIGELLTRVRRVPVGPLANGLKMNAINETSRATGSRYGGIQVYRTNEADALTPKKPKFRQMELNLKKLTGLCYATDELLQDSTALEAVINQAFPEEFSFQLEDEIMNGNGSGQMLGILSSGSLVTVAKEVGQDAATVVAENITKMYARMWARSLQNAVWFVNQDVFPTLYTMGLTVGTGGAPMFFPAGGFNNSPYNTLLGRPIIPVEYCQTVGAVGDIVFADLSQYLMIEKGGLQAAQSIHVRFLNDEQVYRFIMRNDGQPLWNQVLTPKNGTNTISPFIALAAR